MDQLAATLSHLLVWLQWLAVCVVATEAVSEIVVESKFFQPFHQWVRGIAYPEGSGPPDTGRRRWFAWLDSLTSCGYCLSVWVAALFAPLLPGYPPGPGPWRWSGWYLAALVGVVVATAMVWLVYLFTVHRLANWVDVAHELFKRGRVLTHDYTLRVVEAEAEATT